MDFQGNLGVSPLDFRIQVVKIQKNMGKKYAAPKNATPTKKIEVHSWELTYTKALLKMIFLFPSWDMLYMLVSLEGIIRKILFKEKAWGEHFGSQVMFQITSWCPYPTIHSP